MDIVLGISKTETGNFDKPKIDVIIVDCGEIKVDETKPLKQQEL